MKKVLLSVFCFLFICPSIALAEIRQPAEPVSALFYPNEVQVTVEERLTPEPLPNGKGFVLPLPMRAAPNSFSVTVDDSPAGSYYLLNREEDIVPLENPKAPPKLPISNETATRPDQENNPERKSLLQAIVDINVEMEQYNTEINAAQERVARWQNYKPSEETEFTPADQIALDKALGEVMPGLLAAKAKGERMLEDAQERLEIAEHALDAYDAGLSPQSRLVAVVPYNEEVSKPCLVRYTYILPGSYQSSYHIGAFPAKESLTIEQNAVLNQASGITWKNVEVFISTTGRDTTLLPYPAQPWLVGFGSPVPVMSRSESSEINYTQMANEQIVTKDEKLEPTPTPAPTQEEMGTFRLWSIGKRTVESGVPVSVTMNKEDYAAKFYYTLRPSYNSKGFLTAELNLDKAIELPTGNARLFVDNSLVGEQRMSINGRKATLYFGTDPQVVVTRKRVEHSTGEQGIISKDQTILWQWEMTVRNTRGRAIEAWVEDPLPEAQDNAIKLTVQSTPKPEEVTLKDQQGGSKVYRWVMTLEPNETKIIEHKVQIAAPSDKQLNPGRYD